MKRRNVSVAVAVSAGAFGFATATAASANTGGEGPVSQRGVAIPIGRYVQGIGCMCSIFRRGGRNRLMDVASLNQSLYGFAVELRRLAYTMPGGHQDPFVRLRERMVSCAREQVAEPARIWGPT